MGWVAYLPSLDLKTKKEDYEYLLKVLRKEIPIKVIYGKEISIKSFEELKEGMQYKFITSFDSDYVALNGYLKSKKIILRVRRLKKGLKLGPFLFYSMSVLFVILND